jgi:ribose transport system permease protein
MTRLLRRREAGVGLALLLLAAALAWHVPAFRESGNLFLVSRQIAYVAILALGVFFTILTAGIDLSIGSLVSLSGVIGALAMSRAGVPPVLGLAAGLLVGAALGAVNGGLVAYAGVAPFIVTLGMMSVARGLVLIITHGDSIRDVPKGVVDALNGNVGPIAGAVLVLLVVALAAHLLLAHTRFGRALYAVGGNETAAALSGVQTRRIKLCAYVLSGLFSALVGLLYIGRYSAAQADIGKGMELDGIAAAVIGGTSLMGGQGTVLGVILGATLMGVIRNGLVLLQVSGYWQELVIGVIIVLAALLDIVRARGTRR